MAKTTQLSFRLPSELADRIRKRGAPTKFVMQAVQEKLSRDEAAEIEQSLQCLAFDDEQNDISDFKKAQRKVIERAD